MLNLANETDLNRSNEYLIALSNVSIWYMWKNIKKSCKNKSKITATTWNDKFELHDESYSVSNIQYYFVYLTKNTKHWLIIYQ